MQPEQDDEGKNQKAVRIQFHRAAKIAVSEKQECSRESAARAGDTENILQQAYAEEFAVKARDDDRGKKNPGQKHETAKPSRRRGLDCEFRWNQYISVSFESPHDNTFHPERNVFLREISSGKE